MPKSLRERKLKGLIGSDDLCLRYEVKHIDSGQMYLYFMKKTNDCLGYYSEVILIKMAPSKAEIKVMCSTKNVHK